MGDYSMTCSVSGLPIEGGTPVRCMLLTGHPYGCDGRNGAWIVRTPPLRALYNSYGSIERVHPVDQPIADLWLRGLREDTIEVGLGDNSVHDVPVKKIMSLEEMLDAVRSGRLRVRQDVKTFWRGPSPFRDEDGELSFVKRVVQALETVMPGSVSDYAETGKYVVDEPVPKLVRVRYGKYAYGEELVAALGRGLEAIKAGLFVGVIAAGSGRYANVADLLVFPQPNLEGHEHGPQWDMNAGHLVDGDKALTVALAMIREDVWQALIAFPHSDVVSLDCTACGQQSCYHEKDLSCPSKSINKKPYKKHAADSKYKHGPVLPEGVEHVVVSRDYGEIVWYGIDAYKAWTRETWGSILKYFNGTHELFAHDPEFDSILESLKATHAKEKDRVASFPAEERKEVEVKSSAFRAAWEAEELRKKDHPRFGDFHIGHHTLPMDGCNHGSWIFVDSVPGVIGIRDHLSMMLADKAVVSGDMLDALAELSAVRAAISAVGITWQPSISSGPQYAEWQEHVRFHRTMMRIAKNQVAERDIAELCADTMKEVIAVVSKTQT